MGDGIGPATWSVRELSQAIEAALEATFPSDVWVRGEIHDLSRAKSGFVYFSLVDGGDDEDVAMAAGPRAQRRPGPARDGARISVVLDPSSRERVNRLLLRSGGRVRMTDGTEVRIRGSLAWYAPRGQLQLRMASIDPSFTLGQMAVARAELLEVLRRDGLLRRNAALSVPTAPLRIGLITSSGSAAEADVLDTLLGSGFRFEVVVASVRVQGPESAAEVAAAVIGLSARSLDVIVIARGGGATSDLAAFDTEVVARAIAGASVPVVTGIGHETDTSVADEVAHTAAKTPTAAAQLLVSMVAAAADDAERLWHRIATAATHRVERTHDRLEQLAGRLDGGVTIALDRQVARLDGAERAVGRGARHALMLATQRLDLAEARARGLDPRVALERGWSISRTADGRLVRSISDVAPGDEIRTTVADGTIVTSVSANT